MSTAAGKKIAIVTGSALGLGYELARQLIGKGWFVAGIDFNTARQEELSRTFGADEYRAFVGDISDTSTCSSTTRDSRRSKSRSTTRPPTWTSALRGSKA